MNKTKLLNMLKEVAREVESDGEGDYLHTRGQIRDYICDNGPLVCNVVTGNIHTVTGINKWQVEVENKWQDFSDFARLYVWVPTTSPR